MFKLPPFLLIYFCLLLFFLFFLGWDPWLSCLTMVARLSSDPNSSIGWLGDPNSSANHNLLHCRAALAGGITILSFFFSFVLALVWPKDQPLPFFPLSPVTAAPVWPLSHFFFCCVADRREQRRLSPFFFPSTDLANLLNQRLKFNILFLLIQIWIS